MTNWEPELVSEINRNLNIFSKGNPKIKHSGHWRQDNDKSIADFRNIFRLRFFRTSNQLSSCQGK